MRSFLQMSTLLALTSSVIVTAQTEQERTLLLELYQQTGGAAWANNDGWAENSADICSWHGVICEGEDDPMFDPEDDERRRRRLQVNDGSEPQALVIGLDLRSNDLSGRTPDSLWTMPRLHRIDLSFNRQLIVEFAGLSATDVSISPIDTIKIHDTGTTSLTGLSGASDTLISFHVSGAPLQSAIPDEIFDLRHLEFLHMSACALQGTLDAQDWSRLSKLRRLNIAENSLSGSLPSAFAELEHLRVLAVSANKFTGVFPNLNSAVLLHELYADNNEFIGSLPSLSVQPALSKVHLHKNKFTGGIPADFLAERGKSGDFDPIAINLSSNQLSGEIPASLDALQEITTTIHLADNAFTTIATELCDNNKWNNQGETGTCSAIACPVERYSTVGRATATSPCLPCPSNMQMGATFCLHEDDRSILLELYTTTSGPQWKHSSGWNNENDFCNWYGIDCWQGTGGEEDGHVRRIVLPNNGLKGKVHETIFNLKYLTLLDISRNDVVLPFTRISDSDNIFAVNIASTKTTNFEGIDRANSFFKQLYADRLPIDGTLPNEVLQLDQLEVLSMAESQLKGLISEDISQMESLEELYLYGNTLRGPITPSIGDLENLRVLSLADNQLTGNLPKALESLANLEALSLMNQVSKGGGIYGNLIEFRGMPSVKSLHLGDNMIEGPIPATLLGDVDLDTVVTIDLSNNQISGTVPGSLARFERLFISLDGNAIEDIDSRLCAMEHWMDGLVGSFACDAILCPANTAGGRRQYNDLACKQCAPDEEGNWLGQEQCGIDEELLTEQAILERLYEQCGGVGWHNRNNWLSEDEDVCKWFGVTCDETNAVTAIALGANQLIGDFPKEIFKLPKLEKLTLYSNTINFSFEGIEEAENLKTLVLDATGLQSLDGVGQARSLEQLHVRNNRLSGRLSQDVSRLVKLKTLSISDNQLSGEIPFWLSSLPALTSIAASNNKFSGRIYDFGDMPDLEYLDFSSNQLTGSIPTSLLEDASRSDKIVLDLSRNAISGTVPSALGVHSSMSIHLNDNRITDIAPELCGVSGWNDDDVGRFGCDGILCSVGFANANGRQTSDENPCVQCPEAKFMGSTACHGNSGSAGRGLSFAKLGLTVSIVAYLSLLL